jgi:hypothetical protein
MCIYNINFPSIASKDLAFDVVVLQAAQYEPKYYLTNIV